MPYASQQDLIDRAGLAVILMLTDRGAQPAEQIDAAIMARALADADAVINGYLAAKYTLPLTAVPGLIRDLAITVTLYKLHTSDPEAKVKADYDAAMRQLRDVASGMIRLPDAAGLEPATQTGNGVMTNDRERPFTPDNLKGFI